MTTSPVDIPPALDARRDAIEAALLARRWARATALLEQLEPKRSIEQQLLRFARNLAAFEQHRPELAERLGAAIDPGPYRFIELPAGERSIIHAGERRLVACGQDPAATARRVVDQLLPHVEDGAALGVMGVGDGAILRELAGRRNVLPNGMVVPAVLVEPDLELVRACLMLHDFSQPDGPIARPAFAWCVGGDWPQQLQQLIEQQPHFSMPQHLAWNTPHAGAIRQTFDQLLEREAQQLAEVREAILARSRPRKFGKENFWRRLCDDLRDTCDLQDKNAQEQNFRGRVLFVTSRFTTVLQHATRDIAGAFDRMGWRTHTMIEPADHLRTTRPVILRTLRDFDPDLIVVIDHLRNSVDTELTRGMAFVTWIQDDLPWLMRREAGESIGPEDFVLTSRGPFYAKHHAYPLRQCIGVRKLTRQKPLNFAARRDPAGDDLVYVANCSRPRGRLLDALYQRIKNAAVRRVVDRAASRIAGVYDAGASLVTQEAVERELKHAEREAMATLRGPTRLLVLRMLMHPYNDALYRQQALYWVRNVARRLGLRLGLYGLGWDKHPDFADCHRGYARYGDPLADITRQARINLQIYPSQCIHQRLLDGVMAGGFFLIRDHPQDRWMARMAKLLPADASNVSDARQLLHGRARKIFDRLMRDAEVLNQQMDPVAFMQWWVEQGLGDASGDVFPHRKATAFHDEMSLEKQVRRYLDDEPARRRIVADQHAFVSEHYTHESQWPRVLRRIAQRMAAQAQDG